MAKRRRKTRRTGKGRPIITPSHLTSVVTKGTMSAATGTRRTSKATGALPAMDVSQFLSPEQQYLLRVRREAERRQARQNRALVGIALLAIGAASTAIAWLSGWI